MVIDDEGALLHLLSLWESQRAPEVAVAIRALSPRFLRRHPPIDQHHRWRAAAQARDPRSVTALLAMPWAQETLKVVRHKLEVLLEFPPDPRIAAFGEEIRATLLRTVRGGPEETLAAVQRLLDRHGAPPDPPHVRGLPAIGPCLEQELLSAVFAAPLDDRPRQVYRDWLLSIGDPLGPHLHGDLRSTPPMLRAWWCRRLIPDIAVDHVEFRRAFPYRVVLTSEPSAPGWATVEEVSVYRCPAPWLAALGRWPALSAVTLTMGAPDEAWWTEALSSLEALALRALGMYEQVWPAGLLADGRWPELQILRLMGVTPEVRLDEARLGRLSHPLDLELHVREYVPAPIAEAWRAARGCAEQVRQVRLVQGALSAWFERDTSGEFRRLGLSLPSVAQTAGLARRLKPILSAEIDQITVESWLWADPTFQEQVRHTLRRFGRAELCLRAPGA
jgi:uncharacterized protein (TIGR02996 family)